MPAPLYIGVDGGGTNCRVRIADAYGRVLGQAKQRAATNVAGRKPALVMKAIVRTLRAAAREAGIEEARLRHASAGLGLAGAQVGEAREALRGCLSEAGLFRSIEIRTDAYATWLGAYGGADGAILILGTGSCGLAVIGGREWGVGGYGPEISDEASGNWLGREAIRRALWARDGRAEETPFSRALRQRFDDDVEAIISFAKRAHSADFGSLAKMVFAYAVDGDRLASALVAEAAADAERMIAELRKCGAPSVYLHGSLAQPLAERLSRKIRASVAEPINAEDVPLDGAVLMARRAAKAGRP